MSLVIDEEVANRAACIIQRAWRCWVNKAPFKWCKARLKNSEKFQNFHFQTEIVIFGVKIHTSYHFRDFAPKMPI